MMMEAFGLMVDRLMGWDWSSLLLVSIWLSWVWLIFKLIYFTHELHAWVIVVAIKTYYCSHNLTFIGLICHQDNLLYSKIARLVLPFILAPMESWLLNHLAISLDSSAILGLLYYWKELFFDRGLMEKLWCWRLKSRSNFIQSANLLPLHSWFSGGKSWLLLHHRMQKGVGKKYELMRKLGSLISTHMTLR